MTTTHTRYFATYGMGVDSTTFLTRWCLEPETRPAGLEDLSNLTVVTAMTGVEYAETYQLVRDYMLPLFREHGIRFVQIAKADFSETAGIVVLDDSTSPERVVERGPVTLADELERAGTIQIAAGKNRPCTLKWKGFVLDTWFAAEMQGAPYRRAIGFATGEESRVEKDQHYGSTDCQSEYPLIAWGWDRARCIAYLREVFGVRWVKSCCTVCPYQKLRDNATDLGVMSRYALEPEAAAQAVAIEERALRLNPRLPIFRPLPLRTRLERTGNQAALDAVAAAPAPALYTLMRVRRAYDRPAHAWRSMQAVCRGSLAACRATLNRLAAAEGVGVEDDVAVLELRSASYPAREHLLTIVAGNVEDKEEACFARKWAEFGPQLSLWEVAA